MDFMMGVRSLLIRERFLNYGELRRRVEARYPILPRSVAEALKEALAVLQPALLPAHPAP